MNGVYAHLLICASAVGALSLSVVTHAEDSEAAVRRVTFCEVAQSPKDFASQRISVSAQYRSDGQHFEFLESDSCSGGKRIIDIGRHGESSSTHAFYSAIDRLCAKANAPLVCNTSADVTVIGVIREVAGAQYIDIDDVSVYTFLPLRGARLNSQNQ